MIGVIAMIASFIYVAVQIHRNNLIARSTIVAAVLLSPLIGVFVGELFNGMYFYILKPQFSNWMTIIPDVFLSALGMAIGGLVFGIPMVLLYGLPVAYLLRKFGLQYFWMYGLFGFIGGTAFFLLLTAEKSVRNGSSLLDDISGALGCGYGTFGLMTALVFWLIVEYIPLRKKRRQVSTACR